jgi:glutamate synthase domain-containing protein 1|tara:strand:- start:193 stop:414 length:222 start_codon:yes stop_codon:yes gene_type:complete
MSETTTQLRDVSNRTARSMIAVIDAMTQRGAIKGEELSTIGGLRDQAIQIIQLCEQLEQELAMEEAEAESDGD